MSGDRYFPLSVLHGNTCVSFGDRRISYDLDSNGNMMPEVKRT